MNGEPLKPLILMKTKSLHTLYSVREFRVIALREIPTGMQTIDTPERAAEYYRTHIQPSLECIRETASVLLLDTRRRPVGHHIFSQGTLDTLLVSPRDVFRVAIMESASGIIMFHNHPSGDCMPSDPDIRVTRDLIRAGQILKVDFLDHLVMGQAGVRDSADKGYSSLKEMGYWSGV